MIRFLFLLILSTQVLISCGSSNSDDSSQQQTYEDNERRKAAYNRIKGVYEGTLEPRQAEDHPIQVQVVLYTYDVIEQKPDPNGDPIIRTVLLGQFRALGTIGEIDDMDLVTAYDIKTGHITMNNSVFERKTCPVGPKYTISLDGSFANGTFKGSIRKEASTWGDLNLKASGETVAEPITDQVDRLVKFLTPLSGEYRGDFAATDGSNERFPVKLALSVENVQMDFGEGFIYCPDLRGTYSRPDLSGNAGTLSTRAVYRHTWSTIQVTSPVQGSNPKPQPRILAPSPGFDNLTIYATVDKTTHSGQSFTINGFQGDMRWWKYMGRIAMKGPAK